MANRTYYRKTSTSAEPSRKPTFKEYGVKAVCSGCGRKLVAKNEMALWFVGHPGKDVFGLCCWGKAAKL
jgi:hypothetical protein